MPRKKKKADSEEPPRGHLIMNGPFSVRETVKKEEERKRRNARRRELYAAEYAEASKPEVMKRTVKKKVHTVQQGTDHPFGRKDLPGMHHVEEEQAENPNSWPVFHTVQVGESVSDIAKLHGVLEEQIMQWNGRKSTLEIKTGDTLRIYIPKSRRKIFHKVQPGELGFDIATKYGAKLAALLDWNNCSTVLDIHDGDTLEIFTDKLGEDFQGQIHTVVQSEKIEHTVQGERPEDIAEQYGVTVFAIMQWNGMKSPTEMEIGKKLTIHPDWEYLKEHPVQLKVNLSKHINDLVKSNMELHNQVKDLLVSRESWMKANENLRSELHGAVVINVTLRKENERLQQVRREDDDRDRKERSDLIANANRHMEEKVSLQKDNEELRNKLTNSLLDNMVVRQVNLDLRKQLDSKNPGFPKKVYHTVQPGQSIGDIASLYHVSKEEIRKWNNIDSLIGLDTGDNLVIWLVEKVQPEVNGKIKPIFLRAQEGEDLPKLAWRCDVTVQELQDWNRLQPTHVFTANDVLVIYPTGTGLIRHHHVVQLGETLSSLAKKYNVEVNAIRAWNRINDSVRDLHIHQRILICEVVPPPSGDKYLREYNQSLVQEIKQLHKERDEAIQSSTKLWNENVSLRTAHRVMVDQRDSLASQLREKERKLDKTLVDNISFRDENNQLRDTSAQLRNQVASFRKANQELTEANRSLQTSYARAMRDFSAEHLEKENASLKRQLDVKVGADVRYEEELGILRKENLRLTREYGTLRQEHDTLLQDVKHLGLMNKEKTSDNQKYWTNNTTLQKENDWLRKLCDGRLDENQRHWATNADLRRENDLLNERLRVVTHTRDLGIKMKLELYKKYETLCNEVGQLRRQVKQMSVVQNPVEAKAINLLKELLRDMRDGHAPLLFARGDWFEVFSDLMDEVIKEDQDTIKPVDQPNMFMTGCVEPADCNCCAEHDFCENQARLQKEELAAAAKRVDDLANSMAAEAMAGLDEAEQDDYKENEDLQSPMVDVLLNSIFGARHAERKIDTEDDLIHISELRKNRTEELKEQSVNDLGSENVFDTIDDFLAGFSAKGRKPIIGGMCHAGIPNPFLCANCKVEICEKHPKQLKRKKVVKPHHVIHHHHRSPFGIPAEGITKEACNSCPLRRTCSDRAKE